MTFENFVNCLSKKLRSEKYVNCDEANVQTFAYLSILFVSVEIRKLAVLLDCGGILLEGYEVESEGAHRIQDLVVVD